MICTFLRSSFLNSFELCQNRSFIEYNIGLKQPSNKAALQGTCLHSVMEALTLEKLAKLRGDYTFTQEQLGETKVHYLDPENMLSSIYLVLDNENPNTFDSDSYKTVLKLVETVLANAEMDPRNADIVNAEIPVDITIDKPWASYKFQTPNGVLEGQLKLKGTIDLVVKHDDSTYEIRDYKSGSKTDWSTGKTKTPDSLYEDNQVLLYHYMACQTFPQIQNMLFTIYFVKFDEPMTVALDRSDLKRTEKILAEKYKKILSTVVPDVIYNTKDRYKCKFCPFSVRPIGGGTNVCLEYQNMVKKIGYDKTMAAKADWNALTRYGFGGSKGERE